MQESGAVDRPRIPLRRRRLDIFFVIFFAWNLVFICYTTDLEQLIIEDPHDFTYPAWPPKYFVDAAHWYGENYDPLVIARPPFWRMIMWIDALLFGPFYMAAIVAFVRGYEWIRVPALVWSGVLSTSVLIILMEERYGQWGTPYWPVVLSTNLPWFAVAMAMIWRMRHDRPFTSRQEAQHGDVHLDPGVGRPVLDAGVSSDRVPGVQG